MPEPTDRQLRPLQHPYCASTGCVWPMNDGGTCDAPATAHAPATVTKPDPACSEDDDLKAAREWMTGQNLTLLRDHSDIPEQLALFRAEGRREAEETRDFFANRLNEALGALGYEVPGDTPDGRYRCGLCGPKDAALMDADHEWAQWAEKWQAAIDLMGNQSARANAAEARLREVERERDEAQKRVAFLEEARTAAEIFARQNDDDSTEAFRILQEQGQAEHERAEAAEAQVREEEEKREQAEHQCETVTRSYIALQAELREYRAALERAVDCLSDEDVPDSALCVGDPLLRWKALLARTEPKAQEPVQSPQGDSE